VAPPVVLNEITRPLPTKKKEKKERKKKRKRGKKRNH
jgi:hypothetical protein